MITMELLPLSAERMAVRRPIRVRETYWPYSRALRSFAARRKPTSRTLSVTWKPRSWSTAAEAESSSMSSRVSNRRVFARLPKGAPDGLCVDEEGGVWVAAYGSGRVLRFDAEGEPSFEIELPERRVTSVCFGGADRRDLYIVTAAEPDQEPPKGGIHRTRVDVAGLPVPVARV